MVYFIISNSYHIINEEISKILKDTLDIEKIDYNNYNLDEIINLASYTSLFNDSKNMIIKNSDAMFSKSNVDLDRLEKFIQNPNPSTTVIFLFNDKIDERKKVVKLLKERNAYIYIKPLSYKDINNKIIEKCKKLGYKISESNASFITFSSLNNYDIAMQELEKVFLFYKDPTEIKREDLEEIISLSIDDNNFKFVDAVIKKDVKLSFKLLDNLKLFKVEPIVLLSLLAREYRLILFAKQLIDQGYSKYTITQELNLLDWQLDKVINNSYNYSTLELEDKLIDLCELDYQIKTFNIDKYLGLEMFILKG